MKRKEIESTAWKVLLRGDRTELVAAISDVLATAEECRLISTLGDEEYAREVALTNLMIFASRTYSMASNTKMALTMGEMG